MITQSSKKTDKLDARALADMDRANLVRPSHIQSKMVRGHKGVLRQRQILVQQRTKTGNRIHAILAKYAHKISGQIYGVKNLRKVEEMRFPNADDDFVVRDLVKELHYLNERIANLDLVIRGFAGANDDATLIMSMTGLDAQSALLLALEIDDVERFPTPSHLVSWAGLCPTVHQSGDTIWHGRMKKDSSRRVRGMMTEVAWVAIRHDERMRIAYERVCKKHAPQIAMTHVAHKMMIIIWHMLKTREKYRGVKPELYKRKLKRVKAPAKRTA